GEESFDLAELDDLVLRRFDETGTVGRGAVVEDVGQLRTRLDVAFAVDLVDVGVTVFVFFGRGTDRPVETDRVIVSARPPAEQNVGIGQKRPVLGERRSDFT